MKHTAQEEIAKLDMVIVIKRMNKYTTKKLKKINPKQLEGNTPEDIVSDTLLKVLEGTRDWVIAKEEDFEVFLFGCLRSEISNLAKQMKRRDIGLFSYDGNDLAVKDEESTNHSAEHQEEYVPKGYNNYEDQEAYYTDNTVWRLKKSK